MSKTSIDIFNRCERRYALQYLYWFAPVDKSVQRDFKFQGKLMAQEALAGQIVDDVITGAIRRYVEKREWPSANGWMKAARVFYGDYLEKTERVLEAYESGREYPTTEDSENSRKSDRQPLLRLFFREPMTPREEAEMWLHIEKCLSNFLESGILDRIGEYPVEQWKPPKVGVVPWFVHNGIPIYSKYDFAIHSPEETWIFDWKTGKPGPWAERDARRQLHTYALFAREKWGADLDRTRLSAVWLATGPDCLHEEPVSTDVISDLERTWEDRIVELRRRLRLVKSKTADLFQLFPTSGFPKECSRCNFRACDMYPLAQAAAGETEPDATASEEAEPAEPAEPARKKRKPKGTLQSAADATADVREPTE
ncbi:MAG: PD-(D/E)XK nuclease family protein [Fimbriimonadaceae bacterium]